MSDSGPWVLLLVVLLAFAAWLTYLMYRRAKEILAAWAEENGYELVDVEHRLFRRGPFWWSSRNQYIFYVVVRDAEGRTQQAWARCGDWWWGVLRRVIVIRWDE